MSRMPVVNATGGTVASGFKHLATTLLAAPAASFSLTGIGATVTELRVLARLQPVTDAVDIRLRLNNDSGANYSLDTLGGTGSSVQVGTASGASGASLNIPPAGSYLASNARAIWATALTAKATTGVRGIVNIFGLAWGEPTPAMYVRDDVALWNNTASLLNRVDIVVSSGNFATGSMMRVEGLIP